MKKADLRNRFKKEKGLTFNHTFNDHGAKRPRVAYFKWLEEMFCEFARHKYNCDPEGWGTCTCGFSGDKYRCLGDPKYKTRSIEQWLKD